MKIWITTYWTTEIEPVVTPFDNQEAAESCAKYYKRQGYKVCIDECDIFHKCTDTESDAFTKLMESLDEQDRAATEDAEQFLRDIKAKEQKK